VAAAAPPGSPRRLWDAEGRERERDKRKWVGPVKPYVPLLHSSRSRDRVGPIKTTCQLGSAVAATMAPLVKLVRVARPKELVLLNLFGYGYY